MLFESLRLLLFFDEDCILKLLYFWKLKSPDLAGSNLAEGDFISFSNKILDIICSVNSSANLFLSTIFGIISFIFCFCAFISSLSLLTFSIIFIISSLFFCFLSFILFLFPSLLTLFLLLLRLSSLSFSSLILVNIKSWFSIFFLSFLFSSEEVWLLFIICCKRCSLRCISVLILFSLFMGGSIFSFFKGLVKFRRYTIL